MKMTVRQRIDMRIKEEAEKTKKPATKNFFKKRKYVDINTGLVFDKFDTLAENKQLYLDTFSAVCVGKFKNIFDAHAALT